MHVRSGITSSSVYRPDPQLPQKKCLEDVIVRWWFLLARYHVSVMNQVRCVTYLLIFPEFPTASYVLGVPEVTLKAVRGSTTLEVYAPPVHFWQSVQ
jgi:hypothetical protein